MIVALEGPRAVGKTTLLTAIQDTLPQIQVFSGFKLKSSYNLDNETGFCDNQKEYIERKINQYNLVDSSKMNLITRGTENVLFYTRTYPIIKGYNDWQVYNKLKEYFIRLNQQRSDLIIYLDANCEVLQDRNKKDTRQRLWFDKELRTWNMMMKSWFMRYNNCIFIETSNLNANEVHDHVFEILNTYINGMYF